MSEPPQNPPPLDPATRIMVGVARLQAGPDEEPAIEYQTERGVWRVYAPRGDRPWRLVDPDGALRGSYRDAEIMATHMCGLLERNRQLEQRLQDARGEIQTLRERLAGAGL